MNILSVLMTIDCEMDWFTIIAYKIAFWFIFGHNQIHHCHRVYFPFSFGPNWYEKEFRKIDSHNLYSHLSLYDQKVIATNWLSLNEILHNNILNNFHLCFHLKYHCLSLPPTVEFCIKILLLFSFCYWNQLECYLFTRFLKFHAFICLGCSIICIVFDTNDINKL